MDERKVFSLLQVCASIRKSIEAATHGRSFWIKAEIADLRAPGHVYLELVEHQAGVRVASLKGIIWSGTYRTIQEALGNELHNVLKDGSEILFRASARFHEVYGLSLIIEEIDLSYSLGELERRKAATIATLKAEGLYDLNRSVVEPMVIQRIALITSMGSAAYEDFMNHLAANEHGYRFHVRVFSAAVQGNGAVPELIAALKRIDPARFDAVVMIRGGGSKLDLEPFNDLDLCRVVARMPIPVMTGIGHDVDVSVVDMIARSPQKTPTAIADHLVDKCLFFESNLNGFMVFIHTSMLELFSGQKEALGRYSEALQQLPVAVCRTHRGTLHTLSSQFGRLVTEMLNGHTRRLDQHVGHLGSSPRQRLVQVEPAKLNEMRNVLEQKATQHIQLLLSRLNGMNDAVRLLAPDKLLARGFSITRLNGQALVDPTHVQVGDRIETTYAHGRSLSTITSIERNG